ncbi:MAG: nucleotidyltransferase domain-containing protein [Candidatus Methanofastidiosia archaeon]
MRAEKYLRVATSLADDLKKDENVLAVLCYGSLAFERLHQESDIDLLLIVRKLPSGLNIFSQKSLKVKGLKVDLNFKTLKELKREILREAGCWFTTAMVMNSQILYDPNGIASKLGGFAASIPKERRKEVLKDWLCDLESYPLKVKYRLYENDFEAALFLMREFLALAHVLFLLNETFPSSEQDFLKELFKLERKPLRFEEKFRFIYGYENLEKERILEMSKVFSELISELLEMSKS